MTEIRISNMLMQCIKSIQEILPTNVKQNISLECALVK